MKWGSKILKMMGIKTILKKDSIKIFGNPNLKIKKDIKIENFLKDHRVFMTSVIAALIYGGKWDIINAFNEMINEVSTLCEALNLAYRIVELCTGDIGFQSAKTYDIEVWSAGCKEWLEVSSISICTDFQSRRTNTRFRDPIDRSIKFPHTLNGSGLALPRIIIAILENNLLEDGTIEIPEVIREYTKFDSIS